MSDTEHPLNVIEAPLEVLYKNHRGETAIRRIRPVRTFYGQTIWHPTPQWFLEALDVDKMEMRMFAMSDMNAIRKPETVVSNIYKYIGSSVIGMPRIPISSTVKPRQILITPISRLMARHSISNAEWDWQDGEVVILTAAHDTNRAGEEYYLEPIWDDPSANLSIRS